MKTMFRSVVAASAMVALASVIWLTNTAAQEAAPAAPAAAEARAGDDEAGRLPTGYSLVVTKTQRTKIYAIQDSYQKQLDDLKKQIVAIEGKRNQEIESVLDDEQKKIIEYVTKLRERERKQEADSAAVNN